LPNPAKKAGASHELQHPRRPPILAAEALDPSEDKKPKPNDKSTGCPSPSGLEESESSPEGWISIQKQNSP
jgi:hypothetical protein